MPASRDEYIVRIWENEVTALSALHLNNIEDGIKVAMDLAKENANRLDEVRVSLIDNISISHDPVTEILTFSIGNNETDEYRKVLSVTVDTHTQEVNTLIQDIVDIRAGNIIVGKAYNDGSGNLITQTYETKPDAASKLQAAKDYADAQDLAEHNLRVSAEQALDSKIDDLDDKLSQDISDEEERATNAEQDIASDLSDEHNRAVTAESNLSAAISEEETRATNAEQNIANNLASEITTREAHETLIFRAINTETQYREDGEDYLDKKKINYADLVDNLTTADSGKPLTAKQGYVLKGLIDTINGILQSDDVSLDTLQELVTYVKNNKDLIDSITIDKVNVSDIIDNLTSEITDQPLSANQGYILKGLHDTLVAVVNTKAADADVYHKDDIDAKEDALEALIDAEEERALDAESDLANDIDGLEANKVDKTTYATDKTNIEQAIDDEEDRAKGEEERIEGKLDDEILRATAKENDIASDLSDEILRASGEESNLDGKITTEKNRAEGVEGTLSGRITTEVSDRQSADNALDQAKINYTDVVDNLTGTGTSIPLSANQGRVLKGLIDNINSILASDDTDLDSVQEIITYIKNNKDLIDDITTNKVNVSDIIDNLTTQLANKPLSANQGYVLKGLIDALSDVVDTKAAASNVYTKDESDSRKAATEALITAEETRATGAESDLDNKIDKEIEDREAEDDALSAAIDAEETRAKGIEDGLDDKIDKEISDRQAADQGLAADIADEETRATTEEAKKINYTDIVDNLTTDNASKPLSASKGKALKDALDDLSDVVDTKAADADVYHKSDINTLETTLRGLITAEENRASDEEDDLAKAIEDEETRATTEEAKKINYTDIVDNVTTDNASKPLSAKQGKVLKGLIDNINTILSSNDTDLDTLQEVVTYIKNNKDLIDGITTNKVNVSDIVDALTSTSTNKPLSANQGKVLKGLIDSLTSTVNTKAADADVYHKSYINNLETEIKGLISAEETRASGKEEDLEEAIGAEANTRATEDAKKINITDIVDVLTSSATNKPLSAKQGKALKDLIDALTTTVGTKAADADVYHKEYINGLETEIKGLITEEATTRTNEDAKKQNTIDSTHKLDADLVDDSESVHKFVTSAQKQDIADNKTARHTHSNKSLLDTYKQTEENLADAVSKKHNHSNKSILDGTTASFTTALKEKLDGIESSADVNIIEEIKLNGTKINPVSKSVNIDISAYATNSSVAALPHSLVITPGAGNVFTFSLKDANGTTVGTDQSVDLDLSHLLVDGYYDYNTRKLVLVLDSETDDPDERTTIEIPVSSVVDGLVQRTDLNELIANYYTSAQTDTLLATKHPKIDSTHQLDADLVDDTSSDHKFVSSTQRSNIDSNTSARHTHSNKTILDAYTQTEADLADAVSKKHSHTSSLANIEDAVNKRHSHSNKSILDSYNQSNADIADAVSKKHSHTSSLANIEDAVSKKHSHSNKELLDSYEQTEEDLADAVSKKHSHSNKSVLDNTSASFTTDLKTKLDGIASKAQVNVLEGVKVGSTDLTITSKKVTLGTAATKNTGTSSGNVPVLDSNGKLPDSVIPSVALNDTFEAASKAAMLALSSAQHGDICIRTDESKTYILSGTDYATESHWKELKTPTDHVLSVNGQVGNVQLGAANVGALPDNTFIPRTLEDLGYTVATVNEAKAVIASVLNK